MVRLYVVGKKQIEILLARNGYTQKSLSSRVDIVPSYMSSIVNGRKPVGKRTAGKIADELGVKVFDIFFIPSVDKSYTKQPAK